MKPWTLHSPGTMRSNCLFCRARHNNHFLLKGLEKVRIEWSLITLAYNLKRVLNLVSLPKLLAAVA